MSTELQEQILKRVAAFLGTTGDLDAVELHAVLYKYLFRVHPDKYQGDAEKKDAEERFKQANALLEELSTYIQQSALVLKPTDLVSRRKDFELVRARDEYIRSETQLEEMRHRLETTEWQKEQLEKKLAAMASVKVVEIERNIRKEHAPGSGKTTSAAAGIVLSGSWAVLSQLTDQLNKIKSSLPLHGAWIDWAALLIFSASVIWLLSRGIHTARIRRLMRTMTLKASAADFESYLRVHKKLSEFTDRDISDFVREKLGGSGLIARILGRGTDSEAVIDEMGTYFAAHLVEKLVIEYDGARGFSGKYQPTDYYTRMEQKEVKKPEPPTPPDQAAT